MDTLSRLLSLYAVSTALTVRCRFGAPWVLDHPQQPTGIAPYHVILSGAATFDGGVLGELMLNAGDIVVFPHGFSHQLQMSASGQASPTREVPGEHLLRLLGNEGKGAATEILCGEFRFDARASATLLRLETDAMRPGSAVVLSHLASTLFALVMRAWLAQPAQVPGLFGLLAERRLHAVVDGMLAAPGQPWTLDRMASACHMARATFVRLFVRAAGAAPGAVLTHLRMAHGARLLADSAAPLAEIGEAVGYQSESAFSRVFKRSYGVGPGQFRRQLRNTEVPSTGVE